MDMCLKTKIPNFQIRFTTEKDTKLILTFSLN